MSAGEIWNNLREIDNTLTPWDKLSPTERRRWRAYVGSGNYESDRLKKINHED